MEMNGALATLNLDSTQQECPLCGCNFVKCFFLYILAVIAKVVGWSAATFLDDDAGILLTLFAPMPPIRLGSLNIITHPNNPQIKLYLTAYFKFASFKRRNF